MSDSKRDLGMALAIRQKNRKKPAGYAKGGEVGVHDPIKAPYLKGGMSKAGLEMRQSQHPALKDTPMGKESAQAAKDIHSEKLQEMRSMPKPKIEKLAKGGVASSGVFKVEDKSSSMPTSEDPEKRHHLEQYHKMIHHYTNNEDDKAHEIASSIADSANHGLNSSRMADVHHILQQRQAKLAEGGQVSENEVDMAQDDAQHDQDEAAHDVHSDMSMDEDDEHHSSIADAIRSRKKFAQGGSVDLEENAEESGNVEDDLSMDALGKENYSESDMLDVSQPDDSNEMGDEREDEEHDRNDMVGAIRRKMKSRRP